MESESSQDRQTPVQEDRARVVGAQTPRPDTGEGGLTAGERSAKRTQRYIIGGAIAFVVLVVVAIVLMALHPDATQVVRDIAIVFVAVATFLIGLAMIVLLVQLQLLIQILRDEIQPLLHSVNDTASTVRGTTQFVSHNLVSPIIKASGFLAGVAGAVSNVRGVVKATRPRKVTHGDTNKQGGNGDA